MYLDKAKALFERIQERKRALSAAGFDNEWGTFYPVEPVPCTEEEVRALEQQTGRSLPAAYKEFLLWMGKYAGRFLEGSDCFYQFLSDLQKWAVETLEEQGLYYRMATTPNAFEEWVIEALSSEEVLEVAKDKEILPPPNLPKDAFIFFMHQGYYFLFFRTSEGDDPPVYGYKEGDGEFKVEYPHFSEWLMDTLERHARHVEGSADFEAQRTGRQKS